MIFFITAATVLILSVYIFSFSWDKAWARWAFVANMLIISALLVLFGLQYKINLKQPAALRRTVVAALDVSASTGLKMNKFRDTADKIWSNYNIDVIPFSDKAMGVEGAEATGMVKSLKSILTYISGNYNDNNIAGFVLITDGNETEKIGELNNNLNLTGNYHHNVVYLNTGNKAVNFDKSVSIVNAPRFIPKYLREKIYFSVSAPGTELEAVPVDLKLNGKNIGTTLVHLEGGFGQGSIELVIKHTGMNLIEASVAVDSRETITSNNKDYAVIEGIYKGFRVLHISGHPSPDTAFIRRGLQNIPGVDMISFFILRTNTQVSKTKENELSLIPFPTDQLFRDELDNFDLIIINDFQLTHFLNSYYIDNIVKFVEAGGGLLLIGGPQSFKREDYISGKFESILPFTTLFGENYDNREFNIIPNKLSELTSLSGLNAINGLRIKGINKVNLKEWANVFFSTDSGLPVITGGVRGKARVLAVLTDSFWKFSYNSGISNEAALKSLVRYVLGISSMPVAINNSTVAFENKYNMAGNNVYAKIQFMNYDGQILKDVILKPSNLYALLESDSRLLNVSIEQNGRIIDKYQLLNYHEKKWHEHSYLPMGKEYLQNFAKKGNGNFIEADKSDIAKFLKELYLRESVFVSEHKETESPIYENRIVLLFFLYLVISSFYLKSRFT
jgi:uncharacterized membrane protein